MIIFLLLNSFIILGSVFIAQRIFQTKDGIDNLLLIFTLCFAQIVLIVQALGIFGILYIPDLVLLAFAVFCAISFFTIRKKKSLSEPIIKSFTFNRIIYFCLAFIIGFVLIKSIFTLINAPQGWDSLNYHFTFPIEWLKNANLINPVTICDDPTPPYYPINNCLYYFWLIAPFRSVFLADLGQLPFYIAAFFAVFSICRKFDINKEFSFYAGTLLLLTPNFFKQIGVGYADIMAASMFLIALNFLISFYQKNSLKNLVIFTIALGLLLGTKTVAFTYSGILLIPLLILILSNKEKLYFKLRNLSLIFWGLIIFGGYGYIRNFILTGNPLFPLNFKLFGIRIFNGVMDASTYRAHWTSEDYNLGKLFFHEGMGLQLLLVIVPALFIILPLMLSKNKKIKPGWFKNYILVLPHMLYINFRYIIVQLWTRFLYPFLGTGFITAFYVVEKLKINKNFIRALMVVLVLSSAAELNKRAELGLSFGISFLLFAFLIFRSKVKIHLRLSKIPAILSAIFLILLLQIFYLKHETGLYQNYIDKSPYWEDAAYAWQWLNNHTRNDNIAYTGRPVPLPLYGNGFKNRVYYCSVNSTHPANLDKFMQGEYKWGKDFNELHANLKEANNYRGNPRQLHWIRNIFKEKTDFLFCYSLHQTKETIFPLENQWAMQLTQIFDPVFASNTVNIYRVKK